MRKIIIILSILLSTNGLWAQSAESDSSGIAPVDTTLAVNPNDSAIDDSSLSDTVLETAVDTSDALGPNDTIIYYGKENKDSITTSLIPGDAFQQARKLGYDKEYVKSAAILNYLIDRYPKDNDFKYFLARVRSWQGKYNLARASLNRVIFSRDDTVFVEAYRIMAQVELYDENYDTVVGICNYGLKQVPDDEFFTVTKARAQIGLLEYKEALATVESGLNKHPDNDDLKKLKQLLLNQLYIEGLAIGAGVDYFLTVNDPWINGMVQYGKFTKIGAVMGRVNYSRRFAQNGYQFEVDAYPLLGKGRYFYLNAGWSPSAIYPEWRFGAEYYTPVGTTDFEASIGARYVYFGASNFVTAITGSLGYYFGNNYLQGRAYFSTNDPSFVASYSAVYRRFLTGMGDYFQFSAGLGYTPDSRVINIDGVAADFQYNLENQFIGFAYQKIVSDSFYARTDITFTNQERQDAPDNFVKIISFFVTLGFRF